MSFNFWDCRAWLEDILRRMQENNNYDCCICGRDVRFGGRSDENSAICDRCLGIGRCEICNAPRSSAIRMLQPHMTMGELEELPHHPPVTTHWVCDGCKQDLLNRVPEVIDRYRVRSCDHCYEVSDQLYEFKWIGAPHTQCSECLVRLMNVPFLYPISIKRGVRGLMGDIEFKGEDCFIWNPRKITLTREDGHSTIIDIDTEGEIRGEFPLTYGASPHMNLLKHMFIKDGKVIWIAKNCNISGISTTRDHVSSLGSMDIFDMRPTRQSSTSLKMYAESVQIKLEEDVQREQQVQRARQIRRFEIPESVAVGEGVFRTTPQFATPYYDPQDRLFFYCSCGQQGKVAFVRGDTLSHGLFMATIPQMSPGDQVTWECGGGHMLTVVRSIRPPLTGRSRRGGGPTIMVRCSCGVRETLNHLTSSYTHVRKTLNFSDIGERSRFEWRINSRHHVIFEMVQPEQAALEDLR